MEVVGDFRKRSFRGGGGVGARSQRLENGMEYKEVGNDCEQYFKEFDCD